MMGQSPNQAPPGATEKEVADDVDVKVSEGALDCRRCNQVKAISHFTRRLDRPRGFHYNCKQCAAEAAQIKREAAPYTRQQLDVYKERARTWRKNNPGHRNALKAKYKASLVQACPKWLTKFQVEAITAIYSLVQDLNCFSPDAYQVDHIVPIRGKNVCGLHVPWNLQVLPRDLNRKKSNKYGG